MNAGWGECGGLSGHPLHAQRLHAQVLHGRNAGPAERCVGISGVRATRTGVAAGTLSCSPRRVPSRPASKTLPSDSFGAEGTW